MRDKSNKILLRNIHKEISSEEHKTYIKVRSDDINKILLENIGITLTNKRLLPNKIDFNNYLDICIKQTNNKYKTLEIFLELSIYFTNNVYNVFKLLSNEHKIIILKELNNKRKYK